MLISLVCLERSGCVWREEVQREEDGCRDLLGAGGQEARWKRGSLIRKDNLQKVIGGC